MSICLLHGHSPANLPGVGPYQGERYDLCARCGVMLGRDGRAATREQVEAIRLISRVFEGVDNG
jgi:hypothetical protein